MHPRALLPMVVAVEHSLLSIVWMEQLCTSLAFNNTAALHSQPAASDLLMLACCATRMCVLPRMSPPRQPLVGSSSPTAARRMRWLVTR